MTEGLLVVAGADVPAEGVGLGVAVREVSKCILAYFGGVEDTYCHLAGRPKQSPLLGASLATVPAPRRRA